MGRIWARMLSACVWDTKKRKEFRKKLFDRYVPVVPDDMEHFSENFFKRLSTCFFRMLQKHEQASRRRFKKISKQFYHMEQYNDKLSSDFLTLKNDINAANYDGSYYCIVQCYEAMKINISTYNMHKNTFSQFKNINCGKDIVIVATGPTLSMYKYIDNAVHIGVNASIKYDNVKFDYFFAQDYRSIKDYVDEIISYRQNECIKFLGISGEHVVGENPIIPESVCIKAKALRYRAVRMYLPHVEERFVWDLATQPIGEFGSVVFAAAQFALWTNPRRIYLVGCDCSSSQHFDGTRSEEMGHLIANWKKFKEFQEIYYPDVEIVSVNPVGLKGLFKDIYIE